MYDMLRACYRFHCPAMGDESAATVRLSEFRRLERLPGAAHPAVYRVRFHCPCGGDHDGLVTHGDLDYGPLGAGGPVFRNLLTGHDEPVATELADIARHHVRRGNWPWTAYCTAEHTIRPAFPSSIALVAPSRDAELVGVAVACSNCGRTSVNLVTRPHLDVPFFNDPVVRYLDGPLDDGADLTIKRFHERLQGARADRPSGLT